MIEPPPLAPGAPPSAPTAKTADGLAVPVPDDIADPETTIPERGWIGPTPPDAAAGGYSTGAGDSMTPPSERWPEPGDVVYVELLPDPIFMAKPTYPRIALDAGVEGTVLVLVLVGRDGRALDVRIDPRHSVPLLDRAAEEAARRCVFTPALANGRPVIVWLAVPFKFKLR